MLVIKIVLLVVSATAFGGGLYGMLSDIRLRGPWGHRLWEVADYVLFFGVVGLLVSIAWLG